MSHAEIVGGEVVLDEHTSMPLEASRFLSRHGGDNWLNRKHQTPLPHDESTFVPPLRNLYITKTRIGFGVGRRPYTPQGRDQEDPVFYAEHHVQYEWSSRVFDRTIRL